jgi:hypothetical protein
MFINGKVSFCLCLLHEKFEFYYLMSIIIMSLYSIEIFNKTSDVNMNNYEFLHSYQYVIISNTYMKYNEF